MIVPPFTTVVALDREHMGEFRLAQQTWRKHRPEMWQNPMLVFGDSGLQGESGGWWRRWVMRACDHPNIRVVGWQDIPGASQRHRMLSAFVYGAAEYVKTDWMLKIDTDTLARKPPESGWTHPNWWQDKEPYEWISSSWGYTRSVDMWRRLQAWGDSVPSFAGTPQPPGEINEASDKVCHPRLISFVFHARMRFIRELTALHPGPLMPIESQDTFIYYVSYRLQKRYAAIRLKRFGWHHGTKHMEKNVRAFLEEA